jgi:hypothetical protein
MPSSKKREGDFAPSDPAFQARIQASFAKQGLMTSLGASLVHVAPGMVEIALPASPSVSQQHGFVHAGALAAIADTAAGYAALMAPMPRRDHVPDQGIRSGTPFLGCFLARQDEATGTRAAS